MTEQLTLRWRERRSRFRPAHETIRGRVLRTCERCGDSFGAKLSRVRNGQARFCSVDCRSVHPRASKRACATCGERFRPTRVQAQRPGWGRFCSTACKVEAQQEKKIDRTCECCKARFRVSPSTVKRKAGGGRFCSKRCLHETQLGESHPRWLGGWRAKAARRRGLVGQHSEQDVARLFWRQRGECATCGDSIAEYFERDHIIPIQRHHGTNFCGNIQLLCGSCNSRKRHLLPVEFRMLRMRLGELPYPKAVAA